MIVSLIVAAAENGVIGAGGKMPWHLSSDLKNFRRLTMGKPIIMGRKTFASLGKVLDGRDNIVVTRDSVLEADGVSVVNSFDDALVLARVLARTSGADEVIVMGGGEIYELAMPHAMRIYLTRVHACPDGDVIFPAPSDDVWERVSSEALPKGERDDHAATLEVYERRDGSP